MSIVTCPGLHLHHNKVRPNSNWYDGRLGRVGTFEARGKTPSPFFPDIPSRLRIALNTLLEKSGKQPEEYLPRVSLGFNINTPPMPGRIMDLIQESLHTLGDAVSQHIIFRSLKKCYEFDLSSAVDFPRVRSRRIRDLSMETRR